MAISSPTHYLEEHGHSHSQTDYSSHGHAHDDHFHTVPASIVSTPPAALTSAGPPLASPAVPIVTSGVGAINLSDHTQPTTALMTEPVFASAPTLSHSDLEVLPIVNSSVTVAPATSPISLDTVKALPAGLMPSFMQEESPFTVVQASPQP